jgi:hypothetical protein
MLRFLDLSRHSPALSEGDGGSAWRLAIEPDLRFYNHF